MARPIWILLPVLPSCALVSGLSQISIGDDAGPESDASLDVVIDNPMALPDSAGGDTHDSVVPDSGSTDTVVACGFQKCQTPVEACCRTDGGNGFMYSCTAQNQVCTGLLIPCDDATDCKQGEVCCAFVVNTIAVNVTCQASATCTPQSSSAIVCNPNDPKSCPNGGTCTLSTVTLPSYYICK
jgi:hypothetical protein